MSNAQDRAVKNYRKRLKKRGISRFEVIGLAKDRDLIRAVARSLAERNAQAARLRSRISETLAPEESEAGGIYAALRRSPLVGAELGIERERSPGRKVEL